MSKPARIKQLSPYIANQIAAGEVIERPASVVKELLENAFDAHASTICIDIGFGGLNLIRIADDGQGIFADDLPLALAAHATSKIETIEDLYAIQSMGFRGEALASIASVSRLRISSKPESQEIGMMVDNQTLPLKPLPFPRKKGTTIEVCDLFYSTPVRKKFLKSEQSEFQAIEAVVKRFALAAQKVRIQLNHNGKLQFDLPRVTDQRTKEARINKIFGKTFLEQAQVINATHGPFHLEGFVSNADYQRSQNDKVWIFLNQRMVKDKLLHHAIKQSYEDLLHPGRHPACLLYLTVDPEEVDVNVHPTKHEVRFQQPRLIHDFLTSNLRNNLQKSKTAFDFPTPEKTLALKNDDYTVFEVKRAEFSPDPIDCHWFALNETFSLLKQGSKSWLVHVPKLYKTFLHKQLQAASLPLASRPLLVPLILNFAADIACLPQGFSDLGIRLLQKSPCQVEVTSIPLVAQKTAIIPFLKYALEKTSPVKLEDLLDYQNMNAFILSETDKQSLADFIEKTSDDRQSCLVLLTADFCETLFHD